MPDKILRETGDRFLREDGYFILREDTSRQYLWVSDTSYSALDASFSLTECAENGQVGVGGFSLYDSAAAMSIPALKDAWFYDYRASAPRIATGFTHTRTTNTGPGYKAGIRDWDVEFVDLNTLYDDYILTAADSADRPAETDYARMTWLLTTVFGTVGLVTAGVLPNTNTVTMDAIDYRGRPCREVADQCAEITGKTHFLYQHATSSPLRAPLLYYDLASGSSLSSTAKISDVPTEPNGTTVFAVVGEAHVKRSPDEVYSTVHLTWSGGTITSSNTTTWTNFRRREISLVDMGCRTSTTATAKAAAFLAASAAERTYVSDLTISVAAAYVNEIRAGQRVQIKLARHGITAYTYFRVTKRTVTPNGPDNYWVNLSLADTTAPTRYLYQRGSNEVWEVKSNATDDGATVVVNRSGITVTSGAITVTNGSGTVIIDGSSNMYKIAATDVATLSTAASSASTVTTTFSGTGLPAQTPAYLAWLTEGLSPAVTANRDLGSFWAHRSVAPEMWASTTSGGAVNTNFLPIWYDATTHSGYSGDPQVSMTVENGDVATGRDFYVRMHLLKESII